MQHQRSPEAAPAALDRSPVKTAAAPHPISQTSSSSESRPGPSSGSPIPPQPQQLSSIFHTPPHYPESLPPHASVPQAAAHGRTSPYHVPASHSTSAQFNVPSYQSTDMSPTASPTFWAQKNQSQPSGPASGGSPYVFQQGMNESHMSASSAQYYQSAMTPSSESRRAIPPTNYSSPGPMAHAAGPMSPRVLSHYYPVSPAITRGSPGMVAVQSGHIGYQYSAALRNSPQMTFSLPPSAHPSIRMTESDPIMVNAPRRPLLVKAKRGGTVFMFKMFSFWSSLTALFISSTVLVQSIYGSGLVPTNADVATANGVQNVTPQVDVHRPQFRPGTPDTALVPSGTASDGGPFPQFPEPKTSGISAVSILGIWVATLSFLLETIQTLCPCMCNLMRRFALRLTVRSFVYFICAATSIYAWHLSQWHMAILLTSYIIPAIIFYLGFLRGEDKAFRATSLARRARYS